jgi:hypothetical protein
MIVDYYKEHPDPEIQIVEAPKEGEQEDEIEGSEHRSINPRYDTVLETCRNPAFRKGLHFRD